MTRKFFRVKIKKQKAQIFEPKKETKRMTLGQKIRTLRKAKNITQNALVGSEITRNMLSAIESDKALPSLQTLLFLAKELGVSPGFLLTEDATLFEEKKARVLSALKAAYESENYKEVIRLYEKDLAQTDDETALLLAEASAGYAMQLLHTGKLTSAEKHALNAKDFCQKTIYQTSHIEAALSLILAITRNVQAPKYEVSASAFIDWRERAVFDDLFYYASENFENHVFQNPYYAAHADAKRLMAKGNKADAIKALEALEEKKSEKGFSVFILFRVYADLELCHKELYNYEAAYRYSTKRMSLLSAFRA